MTHNREGSRLARRLSRLGCLLCAIALFVLPCIQPTAFAVVVSSFHINQIVQDDGTFTLYASLLDSNYNAVIGSTGRTEDYTIQVGATPLYPDSVSTFSQTGKGSAYIVAVDVSGSVTKAENSAIIQALKDFVGELNPNDYVKIITIGSAVRIVTDYTNDKSQLRNWIDSSIHRNDNKTNLYQGLDQALGGMSIRLPDMPERDVLILFTDGMDDSNGAWTEMNVLERMQTRKAPIYAVAVKGNDKARDLSSINRLCKQTGGVIFDADKPEKIGEAMDNIRSIVNSTTVLTCSSADEAAFGVTDQRFQVSWQAGGSRMTSDIYTLTTVPRSGPVVQPLAFADAGFEQMLRTALGKTDGEALTDADLPAIKALTALRGEKCGIASLEDIKLLEGLETLSLKSVSIRDLTPLQNLDKLTSLTLEDCHLQDISPIKYLTGLTELNLRENKIREIDALKDMTALTSLNLSRNTVGDVSHLLNLSALKHLDLSDNKLSSDLRTLTALTALETLDLSQNNGITDVSALSEMHWLKTLNLRHNAISDTMPLYALEQAGCTIDLTGNATADILAPVSTPTPLTGTQKISKWLSQYWLFALIGFVVVVTGIVLLAVVSARKRKWIEDGIDIDQDLDKYGPRHDKNYGDDPEKTMASDEIRGFDPEKTIPLTGSGATRIRFTEEYAGRTREIVKPVDKQLNIGRDKNNDLVLEDKTVSRNHAQIVMRFDGLRIKDMGSTSGTSVNGMPVRGETPIRQDDVIKMGDTTLKVKILT